ncbi:hypothetical protein GUITHDRAFT_84236 [Guillardia theta CCMP2712]|uniref:PPi-type phosphoenolpyruvate carboxykinase lobe 2 domain-containing protein n=1 Tax=Guillardia theta (strain CCMP2712) TaxID=905079 RepID=L1JZ10_GUITC|nr:hypothetical protein GUITHDRAFT_84236 [Guillardia theta CCMP2712]EKX53617.1 hypothetical protein GUITHDRAFT_84236 [Guillardia theta CCMP2712]|eukprot:XP_005840597.1 hypothetical protein GUITHDRAFT_84236 [Guillardia theta CCMP2712]
MTAYVNLKLAACGSAPVESSSKEEGFLRLVEPILKAYQEQQHVLINQGRSLCPADQRIQDWLDDFLSDVGGSPRLPVRQLKLDRHGLTRILSLPKGEDIYQNEYITSYRLAQGVVHNPKSDKRTTKGVFHVVEGGLPISGDKKAVPKKTFKAILESALRPPEELMVVPYTANQPNKTKIFASLLLRPLACPEVQGFIEEKSHEVRFIVPASMVANLDFVESIFGNGDNPDLAENDAALDPEHWTGTTGLVVLVPHLTKLKAKDVHLPHKSQATPRQIQDGMFWEKEDDLYNGGNAFKLTARDARGVVVTLIADNYFGYCKKEVKTQLGYAANLYGQLEEEHSGQESLGNAAYLGETHKYLIETATKRTFQDVTKLLKDAVEVQPEGYAIDKDYPDIYYIPENAIFSMIKQSITWTSNGKEQTINLKPRTTYVLPSGYKVEMVKKGSQNVVKGKRGGKSGPYEKWHLRGTTAEGANLHKPATVSGGGKSEISKRLEDMIKYGPVFTNHVSEDFDALQSIFSKDYSAIMKPGNEKLHPFDHIGVAPSAIKTLLDPRVSLGTIIKLLSYSPHYTAEHLEFINGIPSYLRELLQVVKQNYKAEWGSNWRVHFNADAVNGELGHEVKYKGDPLLSAVIRVGFRSNVAWKTFTLRQDFFPCEKLQTEDDITASVVVPSSSLKGMNFRLKKPSYKFSQNCEFRLFQRPDEAIHRGYDKITELDMSKPGNFISNFEPLDKAAVQKIVDETIGFEKFTEPMQDRLLSFLDSSSSYVVSSAHPRIVDGKPTKNPRYLQDSMEITDQRAFHLCSVATRLARGIPMGEAVHTPVNSVLCGRRNNPPEGSIPALAVHNPIHYYELPELFMELASSMTGKSPSTTGAGSEGALTKGPFNMLNQIHDLNAALLAYALTETHVFISSAGVIGPQKQVDHDISLLVPEVWSRMREEERDANWLIKNGYLEKIPDMNLNGEKVPSSVLGYRITKSFVQQFFGRVFADPASVFSEDMLKPELQDEKIYADGIRTITVTNKRVAEMYLADGGVDMAVPPLKALLHIMAKGEYEGMTLESPEFRKLFTRESILSSPWYQERIKCFQQREAERLQRGIQYLENFVAGPSNSKEDDWKGKQICDELKLNERIEHVKAQLAYVQSAEYLKKLEGTIGVDPALFDTARGSNFDRKLPIAGSH